MQLAGVESRVKAAKSALNRLHHEVDYAIAEDDTRELTRSLDDFVEALAIMMNVAGKLAPFIGKEDRFPMLQQHFEFYAVYHGSPR